MKANTADNVEALTEAIKDVAISVNEGDRNDEPANLVDGLFAIARGLRDVARVITPCAAAGKDDTGGHVESLTEAIF